MVAIVSTASRPVTFTIRGRNYTGHAPSELDGHIRVTEVGAGGNGTLDAAIEDRNSAFAIPDGADVLLKFSNYTLFGGTLVTRRYRRADGGPGRIIRVSAVSYDSWLDWRRWPRWRSQQNIDGRIYYFDNDRQMVQSVIERVAPMLTAPSSLVSNTNASMPFLEITDASAREMLQQIAETASTRADPVPRKFYVDFHRRLHYYKGTEGNAAPYRIGAGSYTKTVLDTSGLVELWTFREATGATAYGAEGVANATLTGGYSRNQGDGKVINTIGIPNEPSMRSTSLNGTSGYATASHASLHPGDTFSLELWFRRSVVSGVAEQLMSAGSGDYGIRLLADGKIRGQVIGSTDWFESTETVTDNNWHHLVLTKNGATRAGYLDGVALTNGLSNQTVTAAPGSPVYIGATTTPGNFFNGRIQHVAIYSSALSSTTVLAHFNQGMTIVPDELEVESSATDAVHAVYVRGANADGTGWVYGDQQFALGRVTDIIDRPKTRTEAGRDAKGYNYLALYGSPIVGGRFVVHGTAGWRAGQSVYVTDTALGLTSTSAFEIRQIETDLDLGNGRLIQTIDFGALPWSATGRLLQKSRRVSVG